ncbi:hypothetical protein N7468_009325 [Penicillium chermesinum]|uniref:GDT1 family protein n=1 Tax=Penicillium chermesinum TaxID=63820 RepID=A0A9W9NHW4_9EURO|nr:uncharacterized protein N7468_009325 [Penicillium chermesinum]KAJ5220121.1 hypothetical protein N7468_009325 [Penicillium chermesinum]
MKIHPTSILLLLLPALSAALTDTDSYASSNSAKESLEIPVDGKDGRPHAGPWVETSADRDRKSSPKVSDDYEPSSTKYSSKIPASEHISTDDGEMIPHSNGGVMDDPHRTGPKQGTRGTEGGVSEKGKESYMASEKVPGGPKEVPPLPNSEKQKLSSSNDDTTGSGRTADIHTLVPHPVLRPATIRLPVAPLENDGLHSLVFSFTMIIVSEIGDKTFLVAALMAMRHPRLVVFSAAFCALIAMTVLSAVLGHAVPHLIPKSVTKFMAAILFLVFGAKMMKEGREMSPDEGVGEEMREVEQELEEKEAEQIRLGRRRSSVTPHSWKPVVPVDDQSPAAPITVSHHLPRVFRLPLPGDLLRTLRVAGTTLWSDQIATIAMAAGQDYWWVTIGAITGHGICTAAAVLGGRAIAGRVSMRVVTLGGATAFLIFGIIYLIEALFQ